ncbi:MAG: ATP-binding protein [Gammaproteobacteria bacterium]
MKQNKLVAIKNVLEADECIRFLLNRPKMEIVGLGMLYGCPGLGKSTYAQRMAFQRGYIYLRLESTTTPRAFMVALLSALFTKFRMGPVVPVGTANNLLKLILHILEDHKDTVIVIDEIDYAFGHEKLLGAIRDIVDETLTVIILVGMQNARDRLSQINAHYFDRCNYFYEFQYISRQDLELVAREVMDVEVTEEVIEKIDFNSGGNLRKAMKVMYIIETQQQQEPDKAIADIDLRNVI